MPDRHNLNDRIGGGTFAMIVAAFALILAILAWGPGSITHVASNPGPSGTPGSKTHAPTPPPADGPSQTTTGSAR